MNKLIFALAALVCMSTMAEEAVSEPKKINFKEKLAEVNMRRNGGFLERAESFKGRILIVDERTVPNAAQLQEVVDGFIKLNKFNVQVVSSRSVEKCPAKKLKALGANAAIFVVESDESPTLLVAPEDGWAVVNAKKVVVGVEKSRLAPLRIQKETLRALGFVCGGMSTQFEGSIAGPVSKPSDLDGLDGAQLPMDVIATFNKNLAPFGVTPYLRTTYREACKEGWAPAPTNDFQKAIWDKLHELPSKPIKIEFDPKKDK